jgi:hypothetical protein
MELGELKKRIRKLGFNYLTLRNSKFETEKQKEYYYEEETKLRKELANLYNSNNDFIGLNKNEILVLLKLNYHLKSIPAHNFGSCIELSKLLK